MCSALCWTAKISNNPLLETCCLIRYIVPQGKDNANNSKSANHSTIQDVWSVLMLSGNSKITAMRVHRKMRVSTVFHSLRNWI